MQVAELPPSIRPLAGQIVDVDSHEMMPAQVWTETFGEVARPIADLIMSQAPRNKNSANIPGYARDDLPLAPDTLFTTKGADAPGSVDMDRRLEVMDMMAIRHQFLFPTSIGLWGVGMASAARDDKMLALFGKTPEEGYAYARRLIDAHNEWLTGVARRSSRIKAIAPIYGDTVAELVDHARALIDRGMAGIWIATGTPPAGLSPAHDDLDPFYALLAEAGVALHFHIGGLGQFLSTRDWGKAPAFEGYKLTPEISLDPWWLSSVHLSVQNFVATLVTGAVFDRHPTLRVCSQEHGAHWIGPLAQLLDIWHDNNQSLHEKQYTSGHRGRRLPMRPSDYIRRNVRVAPFDFEPVGSYLDNFGLDDVYCFASDYPHVEGGSDPYGKFTAQLERFGSEVLRKFFVANGEVLFPATG